VLDGDWLGGEKLHEIARALGDSSGHALQGTP